MLLKDQIFDLCNKLAQNGWREIILTVTNNQLDIKQDSADKLKAELIKPLDSLNRNIEGFEDFRLDGNQGITALSFSKSLLYHALASPNVRHNGLNYYPSITELDLVENFIYSKEVHSKSLAKIKEEFGSKLVVAVFAYQYRTWEGSCHRLHADMNYARTGVSRVGTQDAIYDNQRRSFWVGYTDGEISVLPCRYAAFLAIKDSGENLKKNFSIMDMTNKDNNKDFIVPIHKLFDGNECLSDMPNVKLDFETYHRNEKLRKVHDSKVQNFIPIDINYDLNDFPFINDDNTKKGFLYSVDKLSGSILIKPTNGKITEPAIQKNKYVAFKVPKNDPELKNENGDKRGNRYNTSFQIPAGNDSRHAPEYVNIRQIVKNINVVDPNSDIENINDLSHNEFKKLLNDGGYLAIDFTDRTGDGFIKLKDFEELPNLAAYSLITAIDFFPLINQRDIFRWNSIPGIIDNGHGNPTINPNPAAHFLQGGTNPLSNGRTKANINYLPFQSDQTFTHTSIISNKQSLQVNSNLKKSINLSISYLTDAASDVFAPGWDVSKDIENGTEFNAAYGLGSPFPEDAKLCAALNSFWPAAAPDASRTFFTSPTFDIFKRKPTAIPLTDEELGIHPKNANILNVHPKKGWDGEYGPFLEKDGSEEVVNYADIARSDYAFNAWKGFMNVDLLRKVNTSQLISRMEALRKCILELLEPEDDLVHFNNLWLVSFQEITNWSARNDRMSSQLNTDGFRFIFVVPKEESDIRVDATDIKRLQMPISRKFECQLDKDTFVWREITQINTITSTDTPKINFISRFTK